MSDSNHEPATPAPGAGPRSDEDAVRVLVVEDRPEYASGVHAALQRADRGRFDVVARACLESALLELASADFDALLLDLGIPSEPDVLPIDFASELACCLPVILLAGTRIDAEEPAASAAPCEIERRLGRAELSVTILGAIRRHRRLGTSGMAPIVCRVPEP